MPIIDDVIGGLPFGCPHPEKRWFPFWPADPGDVVEQRCFSRAVGAQEGDDLSLLDLQIHVVKDRDHAVGGVQVINVEHSGLLDRPQ